MALTALIAVNGVAGQAGAQSVLPDFTVTPTIKDIMAGRDPEMERALAYLEKGR